MVRSARAHNLERAGTWRSDHYAAAAPAARCPGLYDGRGVSGSTDPSACYERVNVMWLPCPEESGRPGRRLRQPPRLNDDELTNPAAQGCCTPARYPAPYAR